MVGSTDRVVRMATRQYSVEDVLAYMEIPLPEDDDDDFSEDEFDGYISEDDDRIQGDGDGSGSGDGSGAEDQSEGGGEGGAGEGEDDARIPAYERQFGCTQDMSDKTPLEFFKLMVTDEMLEKIVQQTNLYAEQFISSHNLAPRSRVHGWKKATHDLSELKKLLALIVVMGLVNYPTLEDYWATYWPYATPTFSKVRQGGIDLWPHLRTGAREHKLSFMIPKWREGLNVM